MTDRTPVDYADLRSIAMELGYAIGLIERLVPNCTDTIIRDLALSFLADHIEVTTGRS